MPAMGLTPLKGDLRPTVLRGATARFTGSPAGDPLRMRVVGTAPLPAVAQPGFDHARLGTGALVTRTALDAMGMDQGELPEWTALRVADGVAAEEVIARHPGGVSDRTQVPTTWSTGGKPAELIQLESVMSLLAGAVC